jgi:CBS domain-containing protein
VLTPDMPLEQVLQRAPTLGGALAAVVADGHVAGVLTSTDIARAVEIRALHSEKSQL